jgi:hypothetical protein
MDVLGASFALDDISWWENDGSPATGTWTEHSIDADFDGAWSVNAADVDGDGDMDVLGAAYYHDDITWWENDGSQSWTEHTIDPDFNGAYSVYAVDVDGDGDMDVVGGGYGNSSPTIIIAWWENDGTPADDDWSEHTIETNSFQLAHSVYAADVDGDGDMDVLGAANSVDDIAWWENDGTPATGNWSENTIDGSFDGAYSVYAADIDGDGDMDVLGAAQGTPYDYDGKITWWEQDNAPSKTVTFTDGSSFSAAPTAGGSNQAIGRFNLNSSATFGFIAAAAISS